MQPTVQTVLIAVMISAGLARKIVEHMMMQAVSARAPRRPLRK